MMMFKRTAQNKIKEIEELAESWNATNFGDEEFKITVIGEGTTDMRPSPSRSFSKARVAASTPPFQFPLLRRQPSAEYLDSSPSPSFSFDDMSAGSDHSSLMGCPSLDSSTSSSSKSSLSSPASIIENKILKLQGLNIRLKGYSDSESSTPSPKIIRTESPRSAEFIRTDSGRILESIEELDSPALAPLSLKELDPSDYFGPTAEVNLDGIGYSMDANIRKVRVVRNPPVFYGRKGLKPTRDEGEDLDPRVKSFLELSLQTCSDDIGLSVSYFAAVTTPVFPSAPSTANNVQPPNLAKRRIAHSNATLDNFFRCQAPIHILASHNLLNTPTFDWSMHRDLVLDSSSDALLYLSHETIQNSGGFITGVIVKLPPNPKSRRRYVCGFFSADEKKVIAESEVKFILRRAQDLSKYLY